MVAPSSFAGGAAFLAAHSSLVDVDLSTKVVLAAELAGLFQDPTALPHLTRLSLHNFGSYEEAANEVKPADLASLVSALQSTAMAVSGQPRPMAELVLYTPLEGAALHSAAIMPGLISLQFHQSTPTWLRELTSLQGLLSAFPRLQQLHVNDTSDDDEEGMDDETRSEATARLARFFEMLAACPLRVLTLLSPSVHALDTSGMAQLARLSGLRELRLTARSDYERMADWRSPTLFGSLTPACFPCLSDVRLMNTTWSSAAVVAFASAAPQLQRFHFTPAKLGVHPALAFAIVGGYCKDIEELVADDAEHGHGWSDVQARDVVDAYNSAVASHTARVRRSEEYRSFTRLRCLRVAMYSCTPPSVWHALLSLLRSARCLQYVEQLSSNDPLVVSSISYLPTLKALDGRCLLPPSFAVFLRRAALRTRRPLFVAASGMQIRAVERRCPPYGSPLHLTDGKGCTTPIVLKLHSGLFPAFQCSLGEEEQELLARWARRDFQAGDEQLSAAEAPIAADFDVRRDYLGGRPCPHEHSFCALSALSAAD